MMPQQLFTTSFANWQIRNARPIVPGFSLFFEHPTAVVRTRVGNSFMQAGCTTHVYMCNLHNVNMNDMHLDSSRLLVAISLDKQHAISQTLVDRLLGID
jgi:hypothetical protein